MEAGAESTQRDEVPEDDRKPDPRRVQLPGRLEVEAQAERDGDLRDQRDEQRAARVAGALQAARVGQRDA